MQRVGLVFVAVMLALATPAAAAAKQIKLTGTVTGTNTSLPGGAAVVSFKEGSKTVGKFTIDESGNCALDECVQGGSGKLTVKVGKLKGKVKLVVDFPLTGFPNLHPAGYGKGTLKNKHASEAVRVNAGKFPTKVGSHFGMTVTT